jgi:hypothetical protein
MLTKCQHLRARQTGLGCESPSSGVFCDGLTRDDAFLSRWGRLNIMGAHIPTELMVTFSGERGNRS